MIGSIGVRLMEHIGISFWELLVIVTSIVVVVTVLVFAWNVFLIVSEIIDNIIKKFSKWIGM